MTAGGKRQRELAFHFAGFFEYGVAVDPYRERISVLLRPHLVAEGDLIRGPGFHLKAESRRRIVHFLVAGHQRVAFHVGSHPWSVNVLRGFQRHSFKRQMRIGHRLRNGAPGQQTAHQHKDCEEERCPSPVLLVNVSLHFVVFDRFLYI